jgi:site-specific DNA-methyltransferase (cytosine-N4-specific)
MAKRKSSLRLDSSAFIRAPDCLAYSTPFGFCLKGNAEDLLQRPDIAESIQNQVDSIFTSPPFPLNRKKKYGNLQGDAYGESLLSKLASQV